MTADDDRDLAVPNDLNLGIPELDDQHQTFFLHVAALRKALIEGMGSGDRLLKTLRYLDAFVSEHFAAEERYMRLYNYPGILVHRLEHEKFAKALAGLKQKAHDLEAAGDSLSFLAVDLEHRLEKWYTEHIRTVDRKMADFLAGKV